VKLKVYFQDDLLGQVTLDGKTLAYRGPEADAVQRLLEYHAQSSQKRGEDLLRYVAGRVRGHTWCVLETGKEA
jgi:hypothetical protein